MTRVPRESCREGKDQELGERKERQEHLRANGDKCKSKEKKSPGQSGPKPGGSRKNEKKMISCKKKGKEKVLPEVEDPC